VSTRKEGKICISWKKRKEEVQPHREVRDRVIANTVTVETKTRPNWQQEEQVLAEERIEANGKEDGIKSSTRRRVSSAGRETPQHRKQKVPTQYQAVKHIECEIARSKYYKSSLQAGCL